MVYANWVMAVWERRTSELVGLDSSGILHHVIIRCSALANFNHEIHENSIQGIDWVSPHSAQPANLRVLRPRRGENHIEGLSYAIH